LPKAQKTRVKTLFIVMSGIIVKESVNWNASPAEQNQEPDRDHNGQDRGRAFADRGP